ncbi:MAG: hypothetical protein LBU07_05570 [Coriobacteriales bacterium]|jgi:hypothetical protein|nr:hypothetical protein [Coriobacteriales bacterium]
MSAYQLKCFLINRLTIIVVVAIALIQVYRFATYDALRFHVENPDPFAFYFLVTPIEMIIFVMVPLYTIFSIPAIHMLENANFCTRLKNRENTVYRYSLLVFLQAVIFAIFINIMSLLILLIKSPLVFDLTVIAFISLATIVLDTLFFSICALLLLAVYALTKKIQLAALVLFCYAIWDFLIDHIPGYVGILPTIGWRLTEIQCPASLYDVFVKALPLLSLTALLIWINLLVARHRDFARASEI